jgi:heat shock protein HtpX
MPKLKIVDSDARNAFASGLNRRQYAVTVTTGLLRRWMTRDGARRHHIRNGDVQMMVTA